MGMTEKKDRRQYHKDYYEKHKDEIKHKRKQYFIEYRLRNKDRSIVRSKEWNAANKDRVRAYSKAYYRKNKTKLNSRRNFDPIRQNKLQCINQKIHRDALSDNYVRKQLSQRLNLPHSEIPEGLIETKREQLKLHRLIREGK